MAFPPHEGLQVHYSAVGPEVALEQGKELSKKTASSHYPEADHSHRLQRQYCCGLSKQPFWIVLVVVLVITIGAVTGGVIGGLKAQNHSKNRNALSISSSATSSTPTGTSTAATSSTPTGTSTAATSSTRTGTSTTATSAPVSPLPTSGILALNCPAYNNTFYNSTPPNSATTYTFHRYCQVNFAGTYFRAIQADSLDSCLDSCASYETVPTCYGATWDGNLTAYNTAVNDFTNCYLSDNITGFLPYNTDQVQASGKLVT